ncbi:MAG: ECF transporter S component [Schwartzia sp.]|nr:ECF transporter S component [Schwartzia sp. (in: firmicutes)]
MSATQIESTYSPISESKISTKELCLCAAMSTIVFLTTFIPKIPIPLGYAHMGDAAVFLIVMLIPKRPALLAAAIGSALADLIGGFYLWIAPTILIKFIMAYIVYVIARPRTNTPGIAKAAFAFTAAALWMTLGYVAFGALLYDSIAAGLASAYGLLAKSAVNIIAALLLLAPLRKALRI